MAALHEPGAEAARQAAQRDAASPRLEYLFRPPPALDRLIVSHLNDQRDAPIAYLFFNVVLLTLPGAALVFWAGSHWVGAAYLLLNYATFLQRFMLALHYSEHRRLFAKGCAALNAVPPFLLTPLFGVPSGMYYLHHCIIHHVGNNRKGLDLSATEGYQRDNLLQFFRYWLRHAMAGWVEVPYCALRLGRPALFLSCLATELAYLLAVAFCWQTNPVAALWVFILPFWVSSLALMLGNWSQHVFVDPANPRSAFGLTYCCIDCADNRKSFNDGYHTLHHLNSQLHWTEFPSKFCGTLEEQAQQDALVFAGIGFFDVGLAVFMRRFKFLARHLVRYSVRFQSMTEAQLIGLLQARLGPIATHS